MSSPWFTGAAEVPTFELTELIATKIRALFQRRKGRDLFDLWLAVRHGGLAPEPIAACFEQYRPDGWTTARALANLDEKLGQPDFTTDLATLVNEMPNGYSVSDAAAAAREVILAAG